jgi:membrane associated rhomboid family serine protease
MLAGGAGLRHVHAMHAHFTPPRGDGPRQPALNIPAPVAWLALALVAIHAIRAFGLDLYAQGDIALLKELAVVPARLAMAFGLTDRDAIDAAILAEPPQQQAMSSVLARTFLDDGGMRPWSLIGHAFLHGGFDHAIINALWLVIFGTPVYRRMGLVRFALLFAVTAAGGALLFVVLQPTSVAILVGASGAISGLTAAAVRFVFTGPGLLDVGHGRVDRPAPPLVVALMDRRVAIFVGVWFAINLLTGLGAPLGGAQIAWQAHVGGFLAGLFLFALFDPVRQR